MKPLRSGVIESAQNPLFKDLKELLTAKGIRRHGRAIVSGARIVDEALRRHPDRCLGVIRPAKDVTPLPLPEGAEDLALIGELFRALDVFGTHHPLLVVSVPPFPRWDPADKGPVGCTLLLPFQDPENVGTVIRSAVAFGVTRVVVLEEGAHPFHPKAVRASSGAVLGAPLLAGPPLREVPESLPVVPLSAEGRSIRGFRFPARFLLLPGIEGPGLPETWRKRAVSIPMHGGVESLNASAAAAIALYAWSGRRAGGTSQHPRRKEPKEGP